MPKTKEQKRAEALERNRRNYDSKQKQQMRYQVGGDLYEGIVRHCGKDRASLEARKEFKIFKEWCDSVKLDTSGNIIK